MSKSLLFSLIAYLISGITGFAGAVPSEIDLYLDLRDSEAGTENNINRSVESNVRRLIPSLTGQAGDVLWVTDKEDYFLSFQDELAGGFDSLAVTIQKAHDVGIEVYPSVITAAGGRIASDHPEWKTLDRNGAPGGLNNFYAISFAYSGARQAKVALLMDLIVDYDIDGIYLDYCRYFQGYGYDQPIIDECINTYGFDPRNVGTSGTQYEQFAAVRANTVTTFVQELRTAIQQSGRNIRMGTLADHRVNLTLDPVTYGRDFPTWAQTGLVEDVFLANYTETPISQIRQVVRMVRNAVGPNVTLNATLTTWNNHLATEEDFLTATREALAGGSDGLWVYREDFLSSLDLWSAIDVANTELYRIKYVGNGKERVGYDADDAAGDPLTVTPAWTFSGDAPMSDIGQFLLQNQGTNPGQQSGEYHSPIIEPGLMTYGSGNYAVVFKVQPLSNTLSGDGNNLHLAWSDDQYHYRVTIDLDSDDGGSGTVGSVSCGNLLLTAVSNIDWSVPHTITVSYHHDDSNFYFYCDGEFVQYFGNALVQNGGTDPQLKDRLTFGDSTTGGSDVNAKWYFVKLYNTSLCGDPRHLSPFADMNRDCAVDVQEMLILGENWLVDNRP